jgi:hypothetical protein
MKASRWVTAVLSVQKSISSGIGSIPDAEKIVTRALIMLISSAT